MNCLQTPFVRGVCISVRKLFDNRGFINTIGPAARYMQAVFDALCLVFFFWPNNIGRSKVGKAGLWISFFFFF